MRTKPRKTRKEGPRPSWATERHEEHDGYRAGCKKCRKEAARWEARAAKRR